MTPQHDKPKRWRRVSLPTTILGLALSFASILLGEVRIAAFLVALTATTLAVDTLIIGKYLGIRGMIHRSTNPLRFWLAIALLAMASIFALWMSFTHQ